jgi:hypothetical protein
MKTTIEDLTWLEGLWVSEQGDYLEEFWRRANAHTLLGTAFGRKGETITFRELMTIEQEGEHLAFRSKHFLEHLNLHPSDPPEPPTFVLTTLEGQRACFERVTGEPYTMIYQLQTDGLLYVANKKQGQHHEFRLRRTSL